MLASADLLLVIDARESMYRLLGIAGGGGG
jgi:hypothetical protein